MDEQGATIKERLAILQKIAPKKSGLYLYKEKQQTSKTATLYLYIRSDENTYALHETFFRKKRAMTVIEWEYYFQHAVLSGTDDNDDAPVIRMGVLKGAIIPGINRRTNRLWDVRAVIGFVLHAVHKSARSKISKGRNKAKSQGRKVGQTNIRRRHGNRSRKAK